MAVQNESFSVRLVRHEGKNIQVILLLPRDTVRAMLPEIRLRGSSVESPVCLTLVSGKVIRFSSTDGAFKHQDVATQEALLAYLAQEDDLVIEVEGVLSLGAPSKDRGTGSLPRFKGL